MKFTDNPLRCPHCGNTEIEPDHNYCMICGLRIKENAPAGVGAPSAGALGKCQLQDTSKRGICQMEVEHYE